MTSNDINHAIMDGNWTNDQLDSFVMAIKFARNKIAHKNRFTFRVGDRVKFSNQRTGCVEIGTLEKINRKFMIVKTSFARWRVPMSHLEQV